MEAILMIVTCLLIVAAYVVWCLRKDRRLDRDRQAVLTVMSPGPRIRELTTPRPKQTRTRKFASGSQSTIPPAPAGGYETYEPAQISAATLGRADTHDQHRHVAPCVEAPSHDVGHHASHHDACSTVDTSHGGFDGGSCSGD